ncbi:hypothetical protein [Pseudomonas iridis]|uniref:hypothetical protein n=1 Tax=Pseudomonas iridis TaxID=2710587 RepID=UPI001B32B7C4|nr:hypothetical protein [Pseudomonas iridis]MBP5971040.1 hypothetical protein [Pseudomonas iridis]
MTNGMLAAPSPSQFTEETQRYLFTRLTRKSAQAAGIQAIAQVAISERDFNALERITVLAAQLVEALDEMANYTGQMLPATAGPQ